MAVQKFADWGTQFDTDNIEGRICWEDFVQACKEKRGRAVRLRFLADRVPGFGRPIVADLSYFYVEVDGKVMDCDGFPLWNGAYQGVGGLKKAIYEVAKKSGAFIPGLCNTALSIEL